MEAAALRRRDNCGAQEQFVLKFFGALFRGENFFFVLFELWGDVALGVFDGLLADVVVGDFVAVRVSDFDVVAEDFVEADFEGGDAGAGDFVGLIAGDPLFAAGGQIAEVIEVWVEARADEAAFASLQGAIVDEGRFEAGADVGAEVELSVEPDQEFAGAAGEFGFQCRKGGESAADMGEIARAGAAGGDAGEQALDIVDAAKFFAEVVGEAAVADEFVDGVQTLVDGGQIGERVGDPIGEEARAHRGDGAIEDGQQRTVALAFAECASDFEAAAGGFVDFERRAGAVGDESFQMGQRRTLRFGQIFQQCAGGAEGEGIFGVIEAETFEGGGAELFGEGGLGGGDGKCPGWAAGEEGFARGAKGGVVGGVAARSCAEWLFWSSSIRHSAGWMRAS